MIDGIEMEVYNPHDHEVDHTFFTVFGFVNGAYSNGDVVGVLLGEDGRQLGGHLSSNEQLLMRDLGCVKGERPDRHEKLRELYPQGYQMEYVPADQIKNHDRLQKTIKLANARSKRNEEA